MRNTMKVAKWEVRRNLKSKAYVVGLFVTPAIFLIVFLLGGIFGGSIFGGSDSEGESVSTTVFVHDQLGVYEALEQTVQQAGFAWEMRPTDMEEADIHQELENKENTAYLIVDNRVLENGVVTVYTSEETEQLFTNQLEALAAPLQAAQLEKAGLSDEEIALVSQGVHFEEITAEELAAEMDPAEGAEAGQADDVLRRVVPGAFAGVIMLSIVFTSMAIFQSASQEKKDKIAEIILSSVTPGELMQGKIIGYFILGIAQVVVFVGLLLPVVLWQIDIPILQYLLVPELLLLVGIAILGYLLFASIFVGIGATMEDMSSSGSYQGMVTLLPFLPFFFIGPVIGNPSGLIAQITTYIPFTSPGILLLRLSMLKEWPWVEIMIALAILIVSIWLFMKLAGKIFKVGILMYGKNATLGEIWKWIRA